MSRAGPLGRPPRCYQSYQLLYSCTEQLGPEPCFDFYVNWRRCLSRLPPLPEYEIVKHQLHQQKTKEQAQEMNEEEEDTLVTPRGLNERAKQQFDEILDAFIDLFRRVDKDSKGAVDKKDAKQWFESLFPDSTDSDDPLEHMFSKLDSDGDNHISLKEWVAYWHKRLSKNFQRSGELKLTDEQLQSFLSSIRNGRATF